MLTLGIDLGTTNSLVGTMDSGFPVLIAGEDGSRLTPSVVYYGEDGEVLVGRPAAAMRRSRPERTVYSVKRLMGLRAHEVSDPFPYPVGGNPGEPARILVCEPPELPENVAARILAKLKADAERATGQPATRAVITVPAYFNDAQRHATRRAGEIAGLEVARIVSEPTAAALAYGLDRLGDHAKIAVFDLGGGTFDVSILELCGGVFEVLATGGDTRLGGDDLDSAIAREFGVSILDAGRLKLGFDSASPADRERLATACLPVIRRTRPHCERALRDAGLAASDLAAVILVGGSTRMELVRRFVAEIFGREPDTSQHPDEAVALGAVIQAGILDGAVRDVTLLDVTPLSLGIETFGGLMNVIIPRNTTIPVKRGEMFTNAVDRQDTMRVKVLQGERELAADNWTLGTVDVRFPPAPRGQARVGVQFEIDADGILRVLARDLATATDHILEIRSALDIDDDAVEKMVGASVEHAFEDMTARQLAEMRIKADEIVPAVESGLALVGADLPPAERERITALVAEVRASRDAGNLQKLKKLVAELDDATQSLATLLVESAMRDST